MKLFKTDYYNIFIPKLLFQKIKTTTTTKKFFTKQFAFWIITVWVDIPIKWQHLRTPRHLCWKRCLINISLKFSLFFFLQGKVNILQTVAIYSSWKMYSLCSVFWNEILQMLLTAGQSCKNMRKKNFFYIQYKIKPHAVFVTFISFQHQLHKRGLGCYFSTSLHIISRFCWHSACSPLTQAWITPLWTNFVNTTC